jgi:GTPase Era involved in 16S rRNA processing
MEKPTSFSSFSNYKQTVIELNGDLQKLLEYTTKMKLEGNAKAVEDVMKRLAEDTFSIAIIGEFNRGKSTLINALLGKDVLPMDVLPTTATLNKISYSITPFVKVEYKDGHSEDVEIDKLNNYVTKLTRESEETAKTIKEACVYYPLAFCKNGVTIIDTPGLNDDATMTEVTMSVLPQVDAALMVVMAQSPFSESEREFLESRVITSDLGRVLFVVTGIDLLDEEDVERVLTNITTRIQEHVMAKAEASFGKDSPEYENYKRKLGKVRVYGLSAKKALKAKLKDDQAMLDFSRFPEFENALEKFLTEDRGAIMLNVPINRIKTSSLELVNAVTLRESALKMQEEEFEHKYKLAMEEIEKIRSDRKIEFSRVNESAHKTYADLQPMIRNIWPQMEKAAYDAVDSFPIAGEDISKDYLSMTQEKLSRAVQNAISKTGQRLTEGIQEQITIALKGEAERLSGFEKTFFMSTEKIQGLFKTEIPNSQNTDFVVSTIASSVVGYGLGGIYLGYKEAGWKGALLGGATSFAGTMLAGSGIGLLVTALAIPATWPVLLVGTVLASLAGTFTGKWVLGKALANDRIEKFKNSFKDAVGGELSKMKVENNFSENVRKQVDEAFEALKTKIKNETETILGDTQNQLTQLKVERAQHAVTSEKEKEELAGMLETVNAICGHADEIGKQLAVILAK